METVVVTPQSFRDLGGIGSNEAESPVSLSGVLRAQIEPSTRRTQQLIQRLEAYDRLSTTEKEERQQWKREDDLVQSAYAKLIGAYPSQIASVLELRRDEPEHSLNKSIERILTGKRLVTPQSLKELEGAIKEYERWVKKAESNEMFVKIATTSIDRSALQEALLAAGARYCIVSNDPENCEETYTTERPEGKELYLETDIEGGYEAASSLPGCMEHFLEFRTASANQSRAFHAFLTELIELGPTYSRKVLDRFVELTLEANRVFYEHAPDYLVRPFVARQLAFSASTLPTIEALKPLVADLKRMKELGAERVFELLQGDESLQAVLTAILPRVEKAVASPTVSLRTFEGLLSKAPLSDRYDYFDAILKVPEVVPLIKVMRKFPITETVFKFARLHETHPEQTLTFLAALEEQRAKRDRDMAVGYALAAPPEIILDDHKRVRLLEYVGSTPKCHLLMPLFIEALQHGRNQRLDVMVAALAHTQNGAELQLVAARLPTLSDEELSKRLELAKGGPQEIAISLTSKRYTLKAALPLSGAAVKPPSVAGTPWLDELITDFNSGGISNRALLTETEVRKAYELLGSGFYARLRGIWQNTPTIVSEFCSDVISFSGRPWFDLIVRDSYLFARYREKLAANPVETRRNLEEFLQDEGEHTVAKVRDWLSEDQVPELPFELRSVPSIHTRLPAELFSRPYNRIIIWGHFHSAERRKRLETAADGMQLTLHDSFDPRLPDKNEFRDGDIVLCLTKAMSHKQYFGIKAAALRRGALVVCTSHEGTDILEEIIGKITANRAAA